jgi:hypothetical protein
MLSRRRLLGAAGVTGRALSRRAGAEATVNLALPGGPATRHITTDFPQKGAILQRARPPLLETPLEVFDEGVLTPNARFFVRWHWSVIPTKGERRRLPSQGARSSSRYRCRWRTSLHCRRSR